MECLKLINKDIFNLLKRNNLLDKLISSELRTNAINEVNVDDETIKNAKKLFMKSQNLGTTEELTNWLNKFSLTEDQLIHKLLDPIKTKKYCEQHFSHRVHSHFLSRKADLDQIIYSLIHKLI